MTEVEKAYLAGFIDGEGSIGIYPDYRYIRSYRLALTVGNTNKEVIDWIAKIVGEKHCRQIKVKTTKGYPSRQKERWKDCYSIWCGGVVTQKILRTIFPYLIVKKEQAIIALEYPMSKYGKNVTMEEKDLRESCYKRIQPFNQTGPNKRGPKMAKENEHE